MNANPDDATIIAWLEGELQGEELARMEAFVQENPSLLEQRDAFRQTSDVLREVIPASVEPPYPDFFNSQIQKRLREENQQNSVQERVRTQPWYERFRLWFAPAAVAAMIVCFFAGTQVNKSSSPATGVPAQTIEAQALYTPYGEVDAQILHSVSTGSTVIVLEGLEAIPDSVDIVTSLNQDNASSSFPVSTGSATY